MPSVNFGSAAPKKGEQPSPPPQISGKGSSMIAPACSATARSSASMKALPALNCAVDNGCSISGGSEELGLALPSCWG